MELMTVPGSGPVTMSSREIAELCEKRHDNVLRTCKDLKATGVCPQIEETPYIEPQNGQTYREFRLQKRDALVVVARLSPEFTARVIDRWQYLEGRQTPPLQVDYSDPKILLGAFQYLQGQVAERDLIIADQQVKVEKLERIEAADGSLCITDAAKMLKVRPKDLFARMAAEGWIYRRIGGSWIGYQSKVQAGWLEHTETTVRNGAVETIFVQVRVTAAGLVKLAEILNAATH